MVAVDINAKNLAPVDNFSASVSSTVTALQTINITENTILNYNLSDNGTVPNLSSHIQNAKDCANEWNNTVKPQITVSLQSITQYSILFNSLYAELSDNALRIQANENDSVSIANFKSEIGNLLLTTSNIYNQSTLVQTTLSAFQDKTCSVSRDFQSDLISVQNKLTADQLQMQYLQQQMGDLQRQLSAAEAKKDEMTSWWMSVLTLGISQLVAVIENLQGSINSLNNRISDVNYSENLESQEMGSLTTIAGTLSQLLNLTSLLQTTMMIFITNWQSLSDNLKEMEGMEEIDPQDDWSINNLQAVNLEWQDIAKEVQGI